MGVGRVLVGVCLASLFCKGKGGIVEEKVTDKNAQIAWEPIYGQDLGAPHGLHAACGLPKSSTSLELPAPASEVHTWSW